MRPPRFRASFRLWQTEMFIVVIAVAILILSGSLSAGLQATLMEMGEASELRNASALAAQLEPDFPVTPESLVRMQEKVADHQRIYSSSVWVYDADGTLLVSSNDGTPTAGQLESARVAGYADNPPYSSMNLKAGGWVIAAKAVRHSDGVRQGVVVTAGSVVGSLAILDSVRTRLWITFWISLAVAGLLGFLFSELISRRVRAMTNAAAAIADGDFEQRLPTGIAPDEIYDLSQSYNRMAVKLGEAFSAISERESEIRGVVESMAEGVVAFSSAGAVRVINPEAARLLGIPAEQLAEGPYKDVVLDPAVLAVVTPSLAGENTVATVVLGELTVLLHSAPLFDDDGAVYGAVLLLADVTERQRMEEAQRRFVSDASHEMRTPLSALKGMLELLNDGAKDDPAVRDDFLRTMQLEVDRLGRLVADLLTLAQLEAGSLQPTLAPVSVTELLTDVVGIMRTVAEQTGVRLVVDAPEPDVDVLADQDRIVQVLLGFVDNALKHAPGGTNVSLRARQEGDHVFFEVADEGVGIEADRLPHVFDRFYRADDARSGTRGAGLGLSIAKEIVEAHGCEIEVESSVGEGTTFGFCLPVA